MSGKNTILDKNYTINCRGKLLKIDSPIVMGIINITPDSFYDGGKFKKSSEIIDHIYKILEQGVDIIDIGAYSSRPGAENVSQKEEAHRLRSVLKDVRTIFPEITISIDTFRSEIAKMVVNEYGADIINDISAGDLDKNMHNVISELKVPYIIMHMKGDPENMQKNPVYKNVVQEVILYLSKKISQLNEKGIGDIIIDPGFGFGKTLEHNYELLNKLDNFSIFGLPLLVGISRKSMIYKLLDITPDEALNGTSVLHTIAIQKGANILRVHDVKEAKEAIHIVQKLLNSK